MFTDFKTSHVKVYPEYGKQRAKYSEISKHLMLKFIRPDSRCGLLQQRISKHLMLKFIFAGTGWRCESSHFKTSHVKVYQT